MLKYLNAEGTWKLINNQNIISVYFLAIISVFFSVRYTRADVLV
jgi:hypothetical protein